MRKGARKGAVCGLAALLAFGPSGPAGASRLQAKISVAPQGIARVLLGAGASSPSLAVPQYNTGHLQGMPKAAEAVSLVALPQPAAAAAPGAVAAAKEGAVGVREMLAHPELVSRPATQVEQLSAHDASVQGAAWMDVITGVKAADAGVSQAVPGAARTPQAVLRAFQFGSAVLGPLVKLSYAPRAVGLEHVPQTGPALLVPNHVSWFDVFVLSYVTRRPVRFIMNKGHYENPKMHWFVQEFGPISIQPKNPESVNRALLEARAALQRGELVAIFPEGRMTYNGMLQRFKRGMETLAADLDIPVIPVHLSGLWGSRFSRQEDVSWRTRLGREARQVMIRFGAPLQRATVDDARDAVEQLGADAMADKVQRSRSSLALEWLSVARVFWRQRALTDSTGAKLTYGKALTASVLMAGLLKPALAGQANVGLLLPPSAGGALANVAMTVLGKVPVNLNYTAPSSAFDHAVEKAAIKTILTSRKFMEALAARKAKQGETMYESKAKLLFLEDFKDAIPLGKRLLTYLALRFLPGALLRRWFFRDAARDLDEDATILFTSGSTGRPKGVELTHGNLLANIQMLQQIYPFGPGERILGVLPFFHAFGLTGTLWLALLSGVEAVYHSDPYDDAGITAIAKQRPPTVLLGTPAMLRRYAERVAKEAFSELELVVSGGEKLYEQDADAFRRAFGIEPLEGYGATETSPVISVNLPDVALARKVREPGWRWRQLLRRGLPQSVSAGPVEVLQKGHKPGSAGVPLPGVAVRVVDPATGEIVPTFDSEKAAPGEQPRTGLVLVKGPNVMKGYLDEPEKTAKALKDGWYSTGDIGYRDRDGFLYLLGRASIKILAEMVSPEVIEEKLQRAAGISERAFLVTAVPDPKTGERLVVLYKGGDLSVADILRRASKDLPRLWRPAAQAFYPVEDFSLLGTGKLDRYAAKQRALRFIGR